MSLKQWDAEGYRISVWLPQMDGVGLEVKLSKDGETWGRTLVPAEYISWRQLEDYLVQRNAPVEDRILAVLGTIPGITRMYVHALTGIKPATIGYRLSAMRDKGLILNVPWRPRTVYGAPTEYLKTTSLGEKLWFLTSEGEKRYEELRRRPLPLTVDAREYMRLVEEEKREHPWLTQDQAEAIVREHLQGTPKKRHWLFPDLPDPTPGRNP